MNNKTTTGPKYLNELLYGSAVSAFLITGIILLLSGAYRYPDLLGMGVLSFTLGLQHAFDADHISAIDNIVRKFVQQNKTSKGVGFLFALGHSTVVIIMSVVTIMAVQWAVNKFPAVHEFSGVLTTAISGGFLIILALINFIILMEVVRNFQKARRGESISENQETKSSSGILTRLIKMLFNLVNHDWQVLAVGFLFGLGFDTATQIAVLATAGSAAADSVPWLSIMSFPILFTAGMTLMDTLDGLFMSTAYQWIFSSPLRKIYYNLTITGLSILAAGVIGTIEIAQVISRQIGLRGGFWLRLQDLNFNTIGFILVGMFLLVSLISFAGWKLLHFDEKEKSIA